MKKYWRVDAWLHALFDLGIDGDERWALFLGRFTGRGRATGTPGIGGWVDARTGLDTVSKRKIPSPHRESNLDHPIVQPVNQPQSGV
jgi:hypothetical protein